MQTLIKVRHSRIRLPEDAEDSYRRCTLYRGADKSLARPSSRCILSDGENISFDASLVIYK